jgi:hypothetical protein
MLSETSENQELFPGQRLLNKPRIRQHLPERWHVVNYNKVDDVSNPGFDGTSLHMYFTGWEGPLNLGSSGYGGIDVHYLETRVSMSD